MNESSKIACVTGASGMVGRRIVAQLAEEGYQVRTLVRLNRVVRNDIDIYYGGLENEDVLEDFVAGADYLYHCAAELWDESKMWEVNVNGTRNLVRATKKSTIQKFVYLSSAGVIGIAKDKLVDENSPCNPLSLYEKTKWEAERLVNRGIEGCSVVILRPTNVVDSSQFGILESAISNTLTKKLINYLRGGECAHIVNAIDVARAALHFSRFHFDSPSCYFVSLDDDPLNTFAGINGIYEAVINHKPISTVEHKNSIPLFIPYMLRKLRRGQSNWGDVKYSAQKLKSMGFEFSTNTITSVCNLLSSNTEHSANISKAEI